MSDKEKDLSYDVSTSMESESIETTETTTKTTQDNRAAREQAKEQLQANRQAKASSSGNGGSGTRPQPNRNQINRQGRQGQPSQQGRQGGQSGQGGQPNINAQNNPMNQDDNLRNLQKGQGRSQSPQEATGETLPNGGTNTQGTAPNGLEDAGAAAGGASAGAAELADKESGQTGTQEDSTTKSAKQLEGDLDNADKNGKANQGAKNGKGQGTDSEGGKSTGKRDGGLKDLKGDGDKAKGLPTGKAGGGEAGGDSGGPVGGLANKLKNVGSAVTGGGAKKSSENKAVREVKKMQKKLALIGKTGGILVKIIINPITWIALFLVLTMTVLLSGYQIMGRSDFANNCNSSTGSANVGARLPEDKTERGNIVGEWLMTTKFEVLGGKPMSKEQAAGVIGNFSGESQIDSITLEAAGNGAVEGYIDPDFEKWPIERIEKEKAERRNNAIGLAQWDSGRRIILLNKAKEQKKPWWDAQLQLEMLAEEIDGSHASALKREFTSCTSVTQCTEAWRRDFEVGGVGDLDRRVNEANEFLKNYKKGGLAGGFSSSGATASCSGSSADMTDTVQLAIAMAYPTSEYNKSKVGGDSLGGSNAKKEYKEGKAKAEEKGGKDPYAGLYASCDRFVATIMKATESDVDFPWGPTSAQYAYLQKSDKWQEVKCGDRKPGDVIITKGDGHIMLYLGDVDGQDSLASASYLDRVGAVGPFTGCSGSDWLADGWPMNGVGTTGFRLKAK